MRPPRAQAGLTLTEIIIAMALLTFMILAIHTAILAGETTWQTHILAVRSQHNARQLLTQLGRDLRVAEIATLTQNATALTMTFDKPDEGAITYTWTTTVGSANTRSVIRQSPSQTRTIATNISAFSITETANAFTVTVTVTSQNTRGQANTITFKELIAKR